MTETVESSERTAHASWDRIEAWLREHAPSTYATLRPPVEADRVAAVERDLELRLPADFTAVLARHDGVTPGPAAFTFPGNDRPHSLAELLDHARMCLDLWEDDEDADFFLGGDYWHRQFVQFTRSNTADGLVLDCRPGDTYGAVGDFFNGDGARFDRWPSYARFLADVADALENGTPVGEPLPYVGVPFDGELLWEPAPPTTAPAEPVSLFERAAREPAPAPAEPLEARFRPRAEDGPAGEYGDFCLTFAEGLDPAELLDRYGALPGTTAARTRVEAVEDSTRWTSCYLPTVRAGSAGTWGFGIEQGHALGAREAVLRRLSRGTRAVSLHFSGFTALSLYEDGRLVTRYDTRRIGRPDGERAPHDVFPGLPGEAERPGPEGPGHRDVLRRVYAALTATLGIRLPPDALSGALPSARVLPLLEPLPVNSGGVPHLDERLDRADREAPERLRRALTAQAAQLAEETGLARYPEVVAALTEGGDTGPVDDDSPLGARLRTVTAEFRATLAASTAQEGRHLVTWDDREVWQRRDSAVRALRALRELPARRAATWILPAREDPHWRTGFVADLDIDTARTDTARTDTADIEGQEQA
ncbi:hypothetical protein GTY65_37170 [Streptomyces sp. SID8379]|uniref:SMI1/KNR4 family protein n=1 Tax=unclassified Streptomyces TaxID=2593676 RepID=UPI00037BDDE5|nr:MULTISPECIES: DUF6461 domain-containing protein [unclassified Streptomyces]MYW69656.1 hypothetical protein [Streptomyces sp. SID8379]